MGTELVRACAKEENMDVSAIPPGFESLAGFTLRKVEQKEIKMSHSPPAIGSEAQTISMKIEYERSEDAKSRRAPRRRSAMNYGQVENASGDESECEQSLHLKSAPLPKGVVRGCRECPNCQKVIAKWRPDEACRPHLDDVPVFYPSEEEFEDTIKYIANIRLKAESYGICRIVPPPSWKPPCPLKQKSVWEQSKFATRIQRVDKLQNRESMNKILKSNQHKRRKKRRYSKPDVNGDVEMLEAESFGFEPGPEITLRDFQLYADDFKAQYFRKSDSILDPGMAGDHVNPAVEDVEGEYWRMVEKPTEEIEVLYGADLETGEFGSGFPKDLNQLGNPSDVKYVQTGWNLNNFPRLPGSVLSYEDSNISGVLVPWLYIGMCFSSFCWHVEDHHLYSLNYLHWGAPKMWYGVPGTYAEKLEEVMRKRLPDLFEEQPDLLHKLVTQLSPSILKTEEVPVYRCVQNPGEFVLTFPRAYHAGFNCGFNCAEAVNVAPVDWILHGHNAIQLYCAQGRKTSISHDKLLLGAAREAVKAHWELNLLRKNTADNLRWRDVCGKDGILSIALRSRVDMEKAKRDSLGNSSQALKMESSFDATSERECSFCMFDLHLSAVGCHKCSPVKYACLTHAKELCSCSWGSKFFLFRYEINELNMLVEALEGKLSAIYRWARLDLGLALTSGPKDNSQGPGHVNKISCPAERGAQQGMTVRPTAPSLQDQKYKGNGDISNTMKAVVQKSSVPQEKPTGGLLSSDKMKTTSTASSKVSDANYGSQPKKALHPDVPTGSLGNSSFKGDPIPKSEAKNTSKQGNSTVILLSDDEEEEEEEVEVVVEDDELTAKATGRVLETPSKDNKEQERAPQTINIAPMDNTSAQPVSVDTSTTECRQAFNASKNDESFLANQQDHISKGILSVRVDVSKSNEALSKNQVGSLDCKLINTNDTCLHPPPCNGEMASNEDGQVKSENDANSRPMDNTQNASGNAFGGQSNLDRYYRQKGPRIAKVIRRINCNVEPLEYGTVSVGKLWCDSRAIYPKGFRSRVKYINVQDPTNTSYYVSEILDAGKDGPVFMVSLEESPHEVFIHMSTARCWEMVREKVNQEIARQHKLGKQKLPPLQPPGSLDGIEMFGFSSPVIIQAIQAMDQKRVCTEYWKSRPLMQIPPQSKPGDCLTNSNSKPEMINDQQTGVSNGLDAKITNLFKKAATDELYALYSSLKIPDSTTDQSSVTRLLAEEIHKRR